jgi:hypothetical protein
MSGCLHSCCRSFIDFAFKFCKSCKTSLSVKCTSFKTFITKQLVIGRLLLITVIYHSSTLYIEESLGEWTGASKFSHVLVNATGTENCMPGENQSLIHGKDGFIFVYTQYTPNGTIMRFYGILVQSNSPMSFAANSTHTPHIELPPMCNAHDLRRSGILCSSILLPSLELSAGRQLAARVPS